jgi:hypothetical protein
MKVTTKIKTTIELEEKDCNILSSGLEKVVSDINRIGLKHLGMTIEESDKIKELNEKLK